MLVDRREDREEIWIVSGWLAGRVDPWMHEKRASEQIRTRAEGVALWFVYSKPLLCVSCSVSNLSNYAEWQVPVLNRR